MNHSPTLSAVALATLAALALATGCASVPENNARLDQARADYLLAQEDPPTRDLAAAELKAAGDALATANDAWSRRESSAEVDHLAYLARQRIALAQQYGRRKAAEGAVAQAGIARDQLRLAARTREVDEARAATESAQRDAQMSQLRSDASEMQAAASQRVAVESQQKARESRQQASDAEQRSRMLEDQIRDLNALQTERGLVVTIGDVLFDTDQARLKPDGLHSVEKLAGFLKEYPRRRALVEGFTDSTGSADHNQVLSGRRADAVRSAIVEMGVGGERIAIHAYGESFPVAGNDSSGGRQANRRVEVILSDEGGTITPR